MQFIRNNRVDIKKYLPDFLFSDSGLKNVTDAQSQEHDRIRLQLRDLQDQFFISSATWALPLYEKELAILPNTGDTDEQRRNRILLKLQAHQTSTREFLEAICRRYMSPDTNVKITEENPANMFHIKTDGGYAIYPSDMLDALRLYRPAHLNFDVQIKQHVDITDEDKICYGMIEIKRGKTLISIESPSEARFEFVAGVGHFFSGHKSIEIEAPAAFRQQTRIINVSIRTGKVKIECEREAK